MRMTWGLAASARIHAVALAAATTIAIVLAACSGGTGPSSSPSSAPTVLPASPSPAATASPGATSPGQTMTAWGRIWNAVPSSFPAFPGARPTVTGAGPASATLDAGPAAPADVIALYAQGSTALGLQTVSKAGPREDGSYDLLVGDGRDCAIEITAARLGTSTIVTIMYGAGCPFA